MRRRNAGMTLLELLMVVVILGIFGGVAIANYQKTIERGYWRVAHDLLTTIYHGERAYYFTHDNNYYDVNESAATSDERMQQWGEIFMDDPNLSDAVPVKFCVTQASTTAFTAVACLRATSCTATCPTRGDSPNAGRMSIDQAGTINDARWPKP